MCAMSGFNRMMLVIAAVLALAEPAMCENAPRLLRTDPDRNATTLNVGFRRIGTLRTRTAAEVGPANWTIDGAPVDRDFVDFDKYCDYLPPLGVSKIRILSGWAKSEKVRGTIDVAWLDHIFSRVHQGDTISVIIDKGGYF